MCDHIIAVNYHMNILDICWGIIFWRFHRSGKAVSVNRVRTVFFIEFIRENIGYGCSSWKTYYPEFCVFGINACSVQVIIQIGSHCLCRFSQTFSIALVSHNNIVRPLSRIFESSYSHRHYRGSIGCKLLWRNDIAYCISCVFFCICRIKTNIFEADLIKHFRCNILTGCGNCKIQWHSWWMFVVFWWTVVKISIWIIEYLIFVFTICKCKWHHILPGNDRYTVILRCICRHCSYASDRCGDNHSSGQCCHKPCCPSL